LVLAPVGRARGLRAGRDRVFAALPLTHVMGFAVLLGALNAGVPLLRRARFDAAEALDLIERRRPNVVVAVPTMYADLERAGAADRDLSSIQVWVSSADAMPTDRARRFQRYGAIVRVGTRGIGSSVFVDIYGMVELSGAAAVRIFPPSLVGTLPVPSFAVALPGIEVRAVDEDGQPVAARHRR
jgi:long-chain acyl-CoA synthetase